MKKNGSIPLYLKNIRRMIDVCFYEGESYDTDFIDHVVSDVKSKITKTFRYVNGRGQVLMPYHDVCNALVEDMELQGRWR